MGDFKMPTILKTVPTWASSGADPKWRSGEDDYMSKLESDNARLRARVEELEGFLEKIYQASRNVKLLHVNDNKEAKEFLLAIGGATRAALEGK